MKRALVILFAALLAACGTIASAGVAAADVVVPPGQFGHVCSGYKYEPGNASHYWQACAWADNNEVYFTINFGNGTASSWSVGSIGIDYYKSGIYHPGCTNTSLTVPAHSVKGTLSSLCDFSRSRAAYQAVGFVDVDGWSSTAVSDTLQVQ